MRKRIFNVPAIISLVLMAAVLVFWQRGQRVRDFARIVWGGGDARFEVASFEGGFALVLQCTGGEQFWWSTQKLLYDHKPSTGIDSMRVPMVNEWDYSLSPNVREYAGAGVHLVTGRRLVILMTKPWPLLLVTAFLPALALLRWWKAHRRHRRGLCIHCGYDLRHTPDRCPECGQPVISVDPAATVPSA